MGIDIEANKKKFKKWCKECIKSEQNAPMIDSFVNYLETTDFFTAPASTKFHSNQEGGLCQHTLNVVRRMFKVCAGEYSDEEYAKPDLKEAIFLAAACHDLCKVNFYKQTTRNKKNEKGEWIQIPFWEVDDDFPMGHGEKSLYLAQKFFTLTDEVAIAIRWHMGFSDVASKGGSFDIGNAFTKYPFALYLNIADNMASFLDEETIKY